MSCSLLSIYVCYMTPKDQTTGYSCEIRLELDLGGVMIIKATGLGLNFRNEGFIHLEHMRLCKIHKYKSYY